MEGAAGWRQPCLWRDAVSERSDEIGGVVNLSDRGCSSWNKVLKMEKEV